ncbi:TonB-dependent receptor [Lentisalinibacter orientalis]|uniref:TonB-dependent receptor n=1 Tax=Lentisalinibacter orientalis TaxID=2992241 RepID=UPI00386695B9
MRSGTTTIMAAVLLAAAGTAQAQEPALEEIVVTAEKREASLQEVPISIAAVSGDRLEELNIDDVMDLYVQTPGMSFSRAGGEAQIYIRGIGTDAFGVTIDPSVALHQDGVYLGRPQMGLTQFLDVDRIEILKGPQGTLYGRNATGGAINIISRMPTPETEGYVTAGYGEWDRRELQGALSGPLGENWQGRIAARYLKDDGFTDDLEPGGAEEIDDQDLVATRAILQYEGEDGADFTLIADYSDFSSGNRSSKPLDDLSFAVVNGALPQAFDETRNNLPTFHDWDTAGLTATLNIPVGETMMLTSVTGWRDYESDFFFNTDGTEIEVTRSYFQYESDQLSQEIRLSSTGEGPVQWLIGGYYLDEDKEGALGLGRATHPSFGVVSFIIPNTDETRAKALFGEVSYDFSEQWTGTFGLRYSDEEKKDFTSVGAIFGDNSGLASPNPVTVFTTRDSTESWEDVSPRFVLEYRPRDALMIYGSVTKGFKSGGWNAFDATPAFEPEEIWAFETGFKSDSADGRLRLNGSFFYYDYTDLQVSTFQDGLTVTTNAADATVWGAEFELSASPIPALVVNASIGYLNTEFEEFLSAFGRCPADATPAELAGPCMGVGPGETRVVDVSGNNLQNAPEWKGNVNGTYTVGLRSGAEVRIFGQVSYQSELFHTQFNDPLIGQDATTLVDGRVAWVSADGNWELAAYGKNLTDEEYFQNTVRFTSLSEGNPADRFNIGAGLGYPAPGRSWGVEATLRF